MNREIRSVWVPIEEPMARETRMACIEPGMAGPFRLVAEALAEGLEPYAVTSTPGGMFYHFRSPVDAVAAPG